MWYFVCACIVLIFVWQLCIMTTEYSYAYMMMIPYTHIASMLQMHCYESYVSFVYTPLCNFFCHLPNMGCLSCDFHNITTNSLSCTKLYLHTLHICSPNIHRKYIIATCIQFNDNQHKYTFIYNFIFCVHTLPPELYCIVHKLCHPYCNLWCVKEHLYFYILHLRSITVN